jgi:hypothetical protein
VSPKLKNRKKQNNMNLNHQAFIFDKVTVTNQQVAKREKPNPRFYKIEISGLTTLQQ